MTDQQEPETAPGDDEQGQRRRAREIAQQHLDIVDPPTHPMAVARQLLPAWREACLPDDVLTVRHWRGNWMRWERTHWAEVDDREIRSHDYKRLEHAEYAVIRMVKGVEVVDFKPWAPTKRKIADLMEAQAAITLLPSKIDAPSWHAMARDKTHLYAHEIPDQIVACRNGLLVVPTRELIDLTPEFFNLVSVPFDCDPKAPEPKRWLQFLADLWPEDPDSIAALQEFFGYVLSGRTDLHKVMLIVGPTRSGKGTIARVLTALVGKANMAGPTLASLCTNFGLSPLLGKPLAIISDARMAGRDSHTVVERLLTISGEDTIDVDRKYREPWTGKMPTRFLILSNELPNFGDSSGTIAHRFIVLAMQVSWLGRENTGLTNELTEELPGILNWALDGLARLGKQGRFTEPATSIAAVTSMKDTASPTSAFVREACETGPLCEVLIDELFNAWKAWCEQNNRDKPGNKQMFGRNLRSVVPQLIVSQPRDGEVRDRVYLGIALRTAGENENHNGPDRVPPRANPEKTALERDGTRSNALWSQHSEDADSNGGPTSAAPPWPPADTGRCANCQTLCHRFGPGGGPLCPACRPAAEKEN